MFQYKNTHSKQYIFYTIDIIKNTH